MKEFFGFLCNNGQCVKYPTLCDGWASCYDRTDELDCGKIFLEFDIMVVKQRCY